MADLPSSLTSRGAELSSNSPLPASLFHAVAENDIEGMIRLYASSCRDTVRSLMANPQSSMSGHSFQSLPLHKEEKESEIEPRVQSKKSFVTQILRDLGQVIENPQGIASLKGSERYENMCDDEEKDTEESGKGQNLTRLGTTTDTDVVMEDGTNQGEVPSPMLHPQQTQFSASIPLLPHFFNDENSREESLMSPENSTVSRPRRRTRGRRLTRNPSYYNKESGWNTTEDIDENLFDIARSLTNTRPAPSFVVYHPDQHPTAQHADDSVVPLFDGAIANSTPMGRHIMRGGGRGSLGGGGGSGTILHLATALDLPLVLVSLLILGGDVMSRHTAFRRLILHEAACANSPKCLRLLLSFRHGKSGTKQMENENSVSGLEGKPSSSIKKMTATEKVTRENKKGYSNFDIQNSSARKDSKSFNGATKVANRPSFLEVLYQILELNNKVKREELSDLDASFHLLEKVPATSQFLLIASSHLRSISPPSRFSEQQLLDCQVDGHGNTPLHWASFKNSVDCVSILLSHQADPNIKAYPSGWTPLHDAAYSDSAESISLLIEAGARVDSQAHSGATPLCFAAQEDAPNATRLLLEASADPSIRCCESGCDGGSATDYSTHHNRFSGYTPLHYCAHYNAYHSARVLIEYSMKTQGRGIDTSPLLEIPELSGRLPIHVAVLRGSSDVLKELLHGGAHIEKETQIPVNNKATTQQPASDLVEDDTGSMNTAESQNLSESFDVPMSPVPNDNMTAIVTPTSSPVLKSLIPQVPVTSSKPWNCISQRSIDQCKALLDESEQNWSPERHSIFHPRDRLAVTELLRVGKRLEQMGTGIFRELWPLVLSFCGREWFEPENTPEEDASEQERSCPSNLLLPGPVTFD